MDSGDAHPHHDSVPPAVVVERARPLPWVVFIVAVLSLVALSGFFARRATTEAARADAAVEAMTRGQAQVRELSATVDSLQTRAQAFSAEARKLAADKEELEKRLAEEKAKDKPVKAAEASRKTPARKKKR